MVITAVFERVVLAHGNLFNSVCQACNGGRAVTPSIVGVGADLLALGVVNSNYIALEILSEEVAWIIASLPVLTYIIVNFHNSVKSIVKIFDRKPISVGEMK